MKRQINKAMEIIRPLPEEFIPVHSLIPSLSAEKVLENYQHESVRDAYTNLFIKLNSSRTEKCSAFLELNETKVMVKVLQPRDIPSIDNNRINLAVIEVNIRFLEPGERTYKHDRHASMINQEVRHVLENVICRALYTNMIFEVFVVVVDDNGSSLSLIINSCILALINGGISIFELVTASTVCMYGDILINNPSGEIADLLDKADKSNGNRNFGIMTCSHLRGGQLSPQVVCSGCFTPDQYKKMMTRCQELNRVLRKKFKKLMRKSVIKSHNEWQEEILERHQITQRVLTIAEARHKKNTEPQQK